MDRTQHTPGPWTESWDYKRLGPNSKRVAAVACGPQHICTGVPIDGEGSPLQPDRATMDKIFADARLIAAAPDLLAAAKLVLAELNSRIDNAPMTAKPVFRGIVELHDAIGKAESS